MMASLAAQSEKYPAVVWARERERPKFDDEAWLCKVRDLWLARSGITLRWR